MAPRSIRILCLHGWRTNAKVLESQTKALREAIESFDTSTSIEYCFFNAPYLAKGPAAEDVIKHFGEDGPYYEWWLPSRSKDGEYIGIIDVQKTLDFIDEYIEAHGPFDVLIGFSQGAAVIARLSAERRRYAWKVNILISGSLPHFDSNFKQTIQAAAPIKIPTIIINGQDDFFWSHFKLFNDVFHQSSRWIFTHPHGHKFPSKRIFHESYSSIAALVHQFCCSSNL